MYYIDMKNIQYFSEEEFKPKEILHLDELKIIL